MNLGVPTLIAALIAAIVSIITLAAQRRSELRSAHRNIVSQHIEELGEAVHQVVATSNIITKTRSLTGLKNWRRRASEATQKIKNIRLKLRYPLWGIHEALHSLSCLPDWVEHARDYPDSALELVEKGTRLASALDIAIKRSYILGRPPKWYERALISWRRRQFRTYYENFQKRKKADRRNRKSG